ncbi:putative ATP-dependent RNA helicase dhr2 [Ascosphaera atra]|nr:putative ATP-dependent RNA helicase dhr2 [Ascosphaera atra]
MAVPDKKEKSTDAPPAKPVYKNLLLAKTKTKKRKADSNATDATAKRSRKDRSNDGVEKGDKTKKKKPKQSKSENGTLSTSSTQKQAHISPLKAKAAELLATRKDLPIFPHADEIRSNLRSSDVMLLVGETGSGKSTQLPQFLVDEPWCAPVKAKVPKTKKNITVGGCIAITQPRRVAAISLARRVADEMGSTLGSSSPASQVGYSVRFDTSVSPGTRVKFLTEGMLLQEMLHDPHLTKYSAVVVDEVHERGVNVDVILGFLKNILGDPVKEGRGGVPLKVVVMSATADMESLSDFFAQGEVPKLPSSTGPAPESSEKPEPSKLCTVCHVKGRQYPVRTIYTPSPVSDFIDAALHTIFQIHMKEPLPGDILVFLTGQETVEALEALVTEYTLGMDRELTEYSLAKLPANTYWDF